MKKAILKITLLDILASLIVIIIFQSCHFDTREKLIVYSPHGKELLGEFEKLYEAKYPNVDIEWLDMGSQEVFDRVSTEARNPQADLWWGAPSTMFIRAEKLNLLEPYKPKWADSIPTFAKSKNDYWYGTFSTPEVIAFNDRVISEARAPKDWNEIVSPAWKNKVILRNPMASGTLRAIFCAMLQQSVANTGSEMNGWLWLDSLDNNISNYEADPTQMYMRLGSKSELVTLWNMPDIVLQKKKNNFPFGYIFPQSGTVVLTEGIAIVKGTKHLELAKSFYEFVTSKESLILQAEKYYRIPSRTDIPKTDLPDWLKDCHYKTLNIDWEYVSEKEADWMQRWDAEIKSKN